METNNTYTEKLIFIYSKLTTNQLFLVAGGFAKITDYVNIDEVLEEYIKIKYLKNSESCRLDLLINNPAACPFCGGTKISFKYSTQQGHGDSGYSDLRVSCNNCDCSKGNLSNYGTPKIEDKLKLIEDWNNRII